MIEQSFDAVRFPEENPMNAPHNDPAARNSVLDLATPSATLAGMLFHPAVEAWFSKTFAGPTHAQSQAWPAIKAGRHVLVAAPTGSGKTLAAFLAAIDDLVRQGVEGALPDETAVVYVSPLKALSNDIQRNLEAPLAGIRAELAAHGLSGRRDSHAGPHRRHAAERARQHAPARRRTSSSRRRSRCTCCWARSRDARCSRRRAP